MRVSIPAPGPSAMKRRARACESECAADVGGGGGFGPSMRRLRLLVRGVEGLGSAAARLVVRKGRCRAASQRNHRCLNAHRPSCHHHWCQPRHQCGCRCGLRSRRLARRDHRSHAGRGPAAGAPASPSDGITRLAGSLRPPGGRARHWRQKYSEQPMDLDGRGVAHPAAVDASPPVGAASPAAQQRRLPGPGVNTALLDLLDDASAHAARQRGRTDFLVAAGCCR